MKAVVMEIKDGYAAVLSEDGRFIKILDRHYSVGTEVTIEEKKKKNIFSYDLNSFRRMLVPSLALLSFAFVMVGVKDFFTPYSTISFDVNPSIEVTANRYDIVLDVEAVDEDAEEIVEEIKANGSRYKKVETVAESILSDFSTGDYEAEDGKTYVVVSANSKKEEHSEKLVNEIEVIKEGYEDISSTSVIADDDLLTKAKSEGTTAGKLYLVESLKEVQGESDFDEEEWIQKPVKEIVKEIESHQKPESEENKEPETDLEEKPSQKDEPVERTDSIPEERPEEKEPVKDIEAEEKTEGEILEKPQNNEEPPKEESMETPPEKMDDMPAPIENNSTEGEMEPPSENNGQEQAPSFSEQPEKNPSPDSNPPKEQPGNEQK